MRVLLVRLRATLMSFGAPAVDDVSPSGAWPTRSMLTGLFGCALGIRRDRPDALARLQERLTYAARCDREPGHMVDLQTAQTSADDMRDAVATPYGWASYRDDQWLRGNPVLRYREYLTDGDYVVAVGLQHADEKPDVDEIARKLDHPEGALCIGRRPCIPSARLLLGVVDQPDLLSALLVAPGGSGSARAIWPDQGGTHEGRLVQIVEDRDWKNDIHVGRRRMREGRIAVGAQP